MSDKVINLEALATTVEATKERLNNKVDKVSGKQLSTEDYTTAEKQKLAGIAAGATANVGTVTGIKMNGASKGSSGVVDLGTVITAHQDISGKVDKVAGKQLSTNDFTDADKTKLDGIAAGAQVNSITGVKGNSEGSYRTGNVNLTPANIGLGNVGNFKAVSTQASQGLTNFEAANARANIGACPDGTYAGGVSAGGAANSAVKLETARAISLIGAIDGESTFDGSGPVAMHTTLAGSIVVDSRTNQQSNPWNHFCTIKSSTTYGNVNGSFLLQDTYTSPENIFGVMVYNLRTNGNRSLDYFRLRCTFASDSSVLGRIMAVVTKNDTSGVVVTLWYKIPGQYYGCRFIQLSNVIDRTHATDVEYITWYSRQDAGVPSLPSGTTIEPTFYPIATPVQSVMDYNNSNASIQIGYAGASATLENISYPAVYADNGKHVKDATWVTFWNKLQTSGITQQQIYSSVLSSISYSDVSGDNETTTILVPVSSSLWNDSILWQLSIGGYSNQPAIQAVIPLRHLKSSSSNIFYVYSSDRQGSTEVEISKNNDNLKIYLKDAYWSKAYKYSISIDLYKLL